MFIFHRRLKYEDPPNMTTLQAYRHSMAPWRSILMLPGRKTAIKSEKITRNRILKKVGFQKSDEIMDWAHK